MRVALGAVVVVLLAGCKSAAPAANYQWTIHAPPQVTLGSHSKLKFNVETRTLDGQPAAEVPYRWVVEWVGVHGAEHQGYSSREEELSVKGGPGTATLRILVAHGGDSKIEVARATFNVVPETLPSK